MKEIIIPKRNGNALIESTAIRTYESLTEKQLPKLGSFRLGIQHESHLLILDSRKRGRILDDFHARQKLFHKVGLFECDDFMQGIKDKELLERLEEFIGWSCLGDWSGKYIKNVPGGTLRYNKKYRLPDLMRWGNVLDLAQTIAEIEQSKLDGLQQKTDAQASSQQFLAGLMGG